MGAKTDIEWTDASWTPVRARNLKTGKIGWHCEHVSEGCRNCYSDTFNRRGLPNGGTGLPYKPGYRDDVEIFLDEKILLAPLNWRRPRKIFAGSMTDLFADFVTDAMLDRIFAVASLCPQHTLQFLTKRPSRMRAYIGDPKTRKRIWTACHSIAVAFPDRLIQFMAAAPGFALHVQEVVHQAIFPEDDEAASIETLGWPLPNVWLGTSVEDQPTADARIPDLLATPAAVRFVSAEPLVRPLTFRWALWTTPGRWNRNELDSLRALDWIIVGGESGPRARPMHPAWARAIRDQCAAAGVPFFFKQWGLWSPYLDPVIQEADGSGEPDIAWPDGTFAWGSANEHGGLGQAMQRAGKKRAGRLLDGVEHNAMPARCDA